MLAQSHFVLVKFIFFGVKPLLHARPPAGGNFLGPLSQWRRALEHWTSIFRDSRQQWRFDVIYKVLPQFVSLL
jgi:hypothetical protein